MLLLIVYRLLNCIDRLYQNELSDEKVSLALKFIKNLTFDYVNIFEYYYNPYMQSENIRKIVLRLSYKEHTDIIIVIGSNKELITIYSNARSDNHVTLREELYVSN